MFIILGIIILGVVLGGFITSPKAPARLSKALNIIIYVLLFVMGITVGGNPTIVNNLSSLGVKALIIALSSLVGSCIFAAVIYKRIYQRRERR